MKAALSYPLFKNPEEFFDEKAASLLFLTERIVRGSKFLDFTEKQKIQTLKDRISIGINNYLDKKLATFNGTISSLSAMNPLNVLSRGYAAVSVGGKMVSSVNEIKENDILDILMSDGSVKTQVLERKVKND